jgi:putative membrane protein
MKKVINFKSVIALSLVLFAVVFMVSCSENRKVDSDDVDDRDNLSDRNDGNDTILVIKTNDDSEFLMEAAQMQLMEIRLGRLAQQKGTSDHVKALGKMMETDHTQNLKELEALAQSKSVTISTMESDDSNDAYEKLNGKTGNDFGKEYSAMMVKHHEDAIDKFEDIASDSEDQQIKTWANSKLAGLKTHLQHAKTCKEECDKMN